MILCKSDYGADNQDYSGDHEGLFCFKWKEPRRAPTEEERRSMLGLVLEFAINMCMEHHFYKHNEIVRRQGGGAGIGLRLSEALGRAFGLYWDDKLLKKLEKLD